MRKGPGSALTVEGRVYIFVSTSVIYTMTINITNKEADRLTRRLAEMEGVGLTEAVVIAVKEALQRRRGDPMESAARLRAEFGVRLTDEMRKPLPRAVWDEMSGEEPGFSPDEAGIK